MLTGLVLLLGCGSAPSEGDWLARLRDEDSSTAEKVRAIDALRERAPDRLGPELLRLLDHPDGGLRRYAWTQLELLLGRRLAFRPYGPIEQRRQAIREIRAVWRRAASTRERH